MKKVDSIRNLLLDMAFFAITGLLTFSLIYFVQKLGFKKSILKAVLTAELSLLASMFYYTAATMDARSLKELERELNGHPRVIIYIASWMFGFSLVITNIFYPSMVKNLVIAVIIMAIKLCVIAGELIYYKHNSDEEAVKRLNRLLDEAVEENRGLDSRIKSLEDRLYFAREYIVFLEEEMKN